MEKAIYIPSRVRTALLKSGYFTMYELHAKNFKELWFKEKLKKIMFDEKYNFQTIKGIGSKTVYDISWYADLSYDEINKYFEQFYHK